MVPMKSSATPIYPGHLSLISGAKPAGGWGTSPFGVGLNGLSACGCGPAGGCGCSGMGGYLGQNASLDQIISNAFNWLGGTVQANLPTSAAVPPTVGSPGAALTTLTQYLPYIAIAYLAYKIIK